MHGEDDWLDWLRARREPHARLLVGIGDDLAVLRWDDDRVILGADQIIEGVHFDLARHDPYDVGAKAVNRNLSDCAAMGCLPAAAVVTAALPRSRGMDLARRLHAGMRDAGRRFDCPLVGGDTSIWDGALILGVSVVGRCAGVAPVTRSGARAGDRLFVTGPLGGSLLGRHLRFEPRVALGRALAESGRVTAMMDLSDGVSRDLARLCAASGVGAVVEADRIPVHDDVARLPPDGRGPVEHALHDGEDYELLFACPDETPPAPAVRIGFVTPGPGVTLRRDGGDEPLSARGWEHRW